jgi:hypothetical protein
MWCCLCPIVVGHADGHAARAIHANFVPRQDPAPTDTASAPPAEETGDPGVEPAESSTGAGADPSSPIESLSAAVERSVDLASRVAQSLRCLGPLF